MENKHMAEEKKWWILFSFTLTALIFILSAKTKRTTNICQCFTIVIFYYFLHLIYFNCVFISYYMCI
jgi:hypothetical protein